MVHGIVVAVISIAVPKPREIVLICPKCNARIPVDCEFCPECGADLHPKKRK